VGFAGIQNLKPAGGLGDLEQAFGVGEEQVGALVGGGAAGEAEGEDLRTRPVRLATSARRVSLDWQWAVTISARGSSMALRR
jgi:hypothetical protein